MDWGSPEFVIAIVAISTFGWIVNNWIRAKHEIDMTKKNKGRAALAAGAIGSAAIAAALLYAGHRKKKNEQEKSGSVPSGEQPETD